MKAYLRCQSSVAGTGRLSAGSASTNTLTKPSQEPKKKIVTYLRYHLARQGQLTQRP